ncbi:MAG TPA: ATP-binding cassette domain-containing protein, partial [Roseiflexaceae bacterium]|nr:ATP-binding cassette domain-containing protein [Roseiflexaceae bacterium]
ERQATMPVRLLSGGERARLMLAKLFAEPGNLIVLDEPTNDLDMDTLDLLQEVLSDFEGTLLLVSHDRDFLDRLVTSTIAVEGDGEVVEYAGGYSDYVVQRGERAERAQPRKTEPKRAEAAKPSAAAPARFSMKEQRELAEMNARLERLHTEISTLETALTDPTLYQRDAAKAAQASALLARKRDELHATEERWLELEEKRTHLSGAR